MPSSPLVVPATLLAMRARTLGAAHGDHQATAFIRAPRVDGGQAIHERDDTFQLRVGHLGFVLHLDGIDEATPRCDQQHAWIMPLAPISFSYATYPSVWRMPPYSLKNSLATCLPRVISKSKDTPMPGALTIEWHAVRIFPNDSAPIDLALNWFHGYPALGAKTKTRQNGASGRVLIYPGSPKARMSWY